MKLQYLVLLFVASILLASCDATPYEDISSEIVNPTYNANIKPIFDAQCTGCHFPSNESPDLTNYDAVKDAVKNSAVVCRIQASCGDVMPPDGALPQATINMIIRWRDQGYVQ